MAILFLLFTLLPIAELYVLIRIGHVIGAWYTILFVILVGFVGAWLAKAQGRKVLREWRGALAEGRVPEDGVLGGLMVLLGGVLLVTPGVISDVAGFFMLLPPTRRALAKLLRRYLERQVSLGHVQVHSYGFQWPPAASAPHEGPRTRLDPRFGTVIDTSGEESR